MPTNNWLARALARAKLYTFTVGGTWVAGDTLTVTMNGKSVTFTCTTTTAASADSGILAALAASTITEFDAITFAALTSTTFTGTADTAGADSTITVSRVTANSGTFSVATTTAATGPNHWNDANNWSLAAVPVDGDTVNVNLDLGSVLYGLAQSAVTLAALNVSSAAETQNTIGLPKINTAGYTEYLDQELAIGATVSKFDAKSPLIKVTFGSVLTTCEVRRTGQSQVTGQPATLLRGTHASNSFDIVSGEVGLAYYDGESAVAALVTVGPAATVVLGSGSAVVEIDTLGNLQSNGTFTELVQGDGTADVRGTPGATGIEVSGGTLICAYSGTITDVVVGPGTIDASGDMTARTHTNTMLRAGGSINDPNQTIIRTNGVTYDGDVRTMSAAA